MDYYKEIIVLLRRHNVNKAVSRETRFKELGVDSLDLMDMVVELEKHFSVELTDDQLLSLDTIGDLVKTLEALKK